nr:hypothetical protein GCM10017611_19500 [Rhodococcus wratislaviensis]
MIFSDIGHELRYVVFIANIKTRESHTPMPSPPQAVCRGFTAFYVPAGDVNCWIRSKGGREMSDQREPKPVGRSRHHCDSLFAHSAPHLNC